MEAYMNRSVIVGVTVLVGAGLVRAPRPWLRAHPIIGTWKQTMEKSTYGPGPPPLKGTYAVRQYAAGEDGSIVAITMNVDAQGLPSLGAVAAANYDGREYVQH